MIIRAKTKELFTGKPLTEQQRKNSDLNIFEAENHRSFVASYPRRLVLELTNNCNLNCVMCGRNSADFEKTSFSMDTFYSLEPLFDTIEEVTLMGWGEPTIHPHFTEMLQTIDKHSARKYFCTNGMMLDRITDTLFRCNVDVFAVSVDGATQESNAAIRRGSDLNRITASLREIVRIKRQNQLKYPHINFVFCAMDSNLDEIPDLVRLAADIGIEEVKVVFLTAFSDSLAHEVLWGQEDRVRAVFDTAARLADDLNILLKLPYIPGSDIAGDSFHKECFVAWRDFFVGSDGYVRPCMSTPVKFFQYDAARSFMDMFNDEKFQRYRKIVNCSDLMDVSCRRCYQSSYCNWNRRESFIQTGNAFSPDWTGKLSQ